MRIHSFILFLSLLWFSAVSQAQALNQNYLRYIDRYKYMAVDQMLKHRIPASITLAQGLLESGAGLSRLAREANNHFGIKCGGGWNGPYILANDDAPNERFRKYRSAKESYEDHSEFLTTQPRYRSLFKLSVRDYKGWAHGLKRCGYATNPRYAYSLIDLIERYDLTQYDKYSSLKGLDKGSYTEGELTTIIESYHTVYRNNDNYYVIAKAGDTFEAIANETGVSPRRLRKYNEVPDDYRLQAGDIIYLERKKRKGHKSLQRQPHIIKPGESMYTIAQKYGIRLENLYKINDLPKDYAARPNDIIWLR